VTWLVLLTKAHADFT